MHYATWFTKNNYKLSYVTLRNGIHEKTTILHYNYATWLTKQRLCYITLCNLAHTTTTVLHYIMQHANHSWMLHDQLHRFGSHSIGLLKNILWKKYIYAPSAWRCRPPSKPPFIPFTVAQSGPWLDWPSFLQRRTTDNLFISSAQRWMGFFVDYRAMCQLKDKICVILENTNQQQTHVCLVI